MHLTRVENSDTKRVSLFWHTPYSRNVFYPAQTVGQTVYSNSTANITWNSYLLTGQLLYTELQPPVQQKINTSHMYHMKKRTSHSSYPRQLGPMGSLLALLLRQLVLTMAVWDLILVYWCSDWCGRISSWMTSVEVTGSTTSLVEWQCHKISVLWVQLQNITCLHHVPTTTDTNACVLSSADDPSMASQTINIGATILRYFFEYFVL